MLDVADQVTLHMNRIDGLKFDGLSLKDINSVLHLVQAGLNDLLLIVRRREDTELRQVVVDLSVRIPREALAVVVLELDAVLLTVDVDLLLGRLVRGRAVHDQRVE